MAFPSECLGCRLVAPQAEPCPFRRARYPEGYLFFRQGDRPTTGHYLRGGLVLLTEGDADGCLTWQGLRGPGGFLDLPALRSKPHRTTARALGAAEVCSIPLDRLQYWLGPEPSPARALLDLALDEATILARDRTLREATAVRRVATFLLEHTEPGGSLGLQKQTLAGLLSMRPETISRVLTRLRRAKVISHGRRIRVLDRAGLGAWAIPRERA